MNDSIAIIGEENYSPPLFNLKKIQAAEFDVSHPFLLNLGKNEVFYAQELLRIIPKRRIVSLGIWQGRLAVAKIFFNKIYAHKHAEKELLGVNILQNNKVPTPQVLYHGTAHHYVEIIIYEYLAEAKSLAELWRDRSQERCEAILKDVMVELATQHVLGIVQRDLHLKNFLTRKNLIYTLDGGEITQKQQLLPKAESLEQLALFLSQLGVGYARLQHKLLKAYCQARGWILRPALLQKIFIAIERWNSERWQSYRKKIFRNSTQFLQVAENGFEGMCDRAFTRGELAKFIHNPELAFSDSRMRLIKNGRSATVICLELAEGNFLIKRHNMKNFLHRLRRFFRTTRAAKVWLVSNKLELFSIPVARPVAYLEKRRFGLHTTSYYLSEWVEGIPLREYLNTQGELEIRHLIKRIQRFLLNLQKINIAHGDLKETNVLVTAKGEPILIDFDTASEHRFKFFLKRGLNRDIKRLIYNFRQEVQLANLFKKLLIG